MIKKSQMPECPIATTVNLIGNKWKPLIIRNLLKGSQRFKYLQYGIEGISPKVLSENLKQMEADGLVKRTIYDKTPIRVEYALTDLGERMRPIIDAMKEWGTEYKKIIAAQN